MLAGVVCGGRFAFFLQLPICPFFLQLPIVTRIATSFMVQSHVYMCVLLTVYIANITAKKD